MALVKTSVGFLFLVSSVLPLACHEEAGTSPGGPGGDGDAGDGDGDGDAGDGDGDGDSAFGGAFGGDGDITPPRCGVDEEPGTELTNPQSEGEGRCAGVSVEEFVRAIRAQNPELADVTEMHAEVSDGESASYYVTFIENDGGLRAVFQQGSGDCPSGCIDNLFHYFEAGDTCEPVLAGSYSNVQNYDDNCREISGEPRWGYPVASPTTNSCDPPEAPVIEGTFEIPFSGTHLECSTKGGASGQAVSGTLELTISPASTLGESIVTLKSSAFDLPWLESSEFSAVFDYLQGRVETQWDNTPTTCLETYALSMNLDLEVCFEGHLFYEEAIDTACSDDLCKGSLYLDLDLSSLRSLLEMR